MIFLLDFYTENPKNMQTSALEQLAERGMVFIQKKGDEWLVECVRRDEYGFLVGRVCVWGKNLDRVLKELQEKLSLASIGKDGDG